MSFKTKKILPRKVGPIKTDELDEWAGYIGGILDGEGTITIRYSKRDNHFSPHMKIGMTDKRVIGFIAGIFGVDFKEYSRKGKLPIYVTYVLDRKDLREILLTLMDKPWLIATKRNAEIVLDFLEDPPIKGKLTQEHIDLFVEIKQLSKKGPKFDEKYWRNYLGQFL